MCTRRALVALAASLLGWSPQARAQEYPNRPVRLVVPFAPGGASDLVARIIAERLTPLLGQPVVVENKAGGGGAVGALEVVKSRADGYTLSLATVSTVAANPAINPKNPYDPIEDFSPIVNIAATPMLMAVHPSLPARDYPAYLALMRRSPGRYNYATAGAGGVSHLQMELFKSLTGIFVTHIPYRGSGPALTDTVAGVTQIMFDPTPSILPFVKEGKLVPIAVASSRRLAELPAVPTFKELGLEQVNRMAFYGLLGPKGLPGEIASRLATAVRTALADPAGRARIEATGAIVVGNTPAEFAEQIRAEYAVYRRVVAQQKLSLE
ncbi:MAG: tripartite tricarboxylate transporter substrate binding protein BugE [Rubrivivax sp.]